MGGVSRNRRKSLALLGDPSVSRVIVEHRDRFARFFVEYLEAALAAQSRKLIVVDPAELADDLISDMTETLTSSSDKFLCLALR